MDAPKGREIEQYDKVRAIYDPKRTDDLVPGCEKWIGREGNYWLAGWIIEEGEYEGQWAMAIPRSWLFTKNDPFPAAWVPHCDLTILEWVDTPYSES